MKPRHKSNAESEEIKASIEETRAQMDETLDELTERLQPRHILDDVLDYFRNRRSSGVSSGKRGRLKEAAGSAASHVKHKAGNAAARVKRKAGDAGRGTVRQVKQHPLPALLIGAGISMLLMERYRGENEDDYDTDYAGGPNSDSQYEPEYAEDAGYMSETVGYAEIETFEGPGPESFALPQHYSEQGQGSAGMMGKLKGKTSHLKEQAGARLEGIKHQAGNKLQDMKHRTSETTRRLRERASESGAQLRDQAQHTYESVRDQAHHTYETVRDQAHHTYEAGVDTFKRTADERPLAMGLAFLALGVVAGVLLPSTRREDELVGPARDRLVTRSRELAEDAVERGKNVARTAADTVAREAREQGLTPEALKERAQKVATRAQEATREEAMHQQDALRDELKQS